MSNFPDLIVTMDGLITTPQGVEFHWTLTGTNAGPDGTGKRISISGLELWQFDKDGLVSDSAGSFNIEEYNRQLQHGSGS